MRTKHCRPFMDSGSIVHRDDAAEVFACKRAVKRLSYAQWVDLLQDFQDSGQLSDS